LPSIFFLIYELSLFDMFSSVKQNYRNFDIRDCLV
jgi:hypothetical protein